MIKYICLTLLLLLYIMCENKSKDNNCDIDIFSLKKIDKNNCRYSPAINLINKNGEINIEIFDKDKYSYIEFYQTKDFYILKDTFNNEIVDQKLISDVYISKKKSEIWIFKYGCFKNGCLINSLSLYKKVSNNTFTLQTFDVHKKKIVNNTILTPPIEIDSMCKKYDISTCIDCIIINKNNKIYEECYDKKKHKKSNIVYYTERDFSFFWHIFLENLALPLFTSYGMLIKKK